MAADGKVQIDVELNADEATKGLKGIENDAEQLGENGGKSVGKFGAALGRIAGPAAIATGAVVGVGTAVLGIVGPISRAAASAQALNNQFSQVFGELEATATTNLNKIAEETNILPDRLKGTFTQIAAFAKTSGQDTASSLDLATRATIAAADSAAFYDKNLDEVTESLQSFLKGNYENDAALGISSTETTRNALANELFGKSFNDLTEAQKQFTLLRSIEQGNELSGALGAASREGEGLENVTGNLASAWNSLLVQFGTPILGYVTQAIVFLTQALQGFNLQSVIASFQAFYAQSAPLQALFAFIQSAIAQVKAYIDTNGPSIFQTLTDVFNGLKATVDFIFPAVLFVIQFVWDAIVNVITGAISIIQGVVNVLKGIFTGDFTTLWEGVKQIFSGAIDFIIGLLSLTFVGGIRTLITNLGKTLINLIKNSWSTITNTIRTFGNNILTAIGNLVKGAINFFTNIAKQGVQNFNTLRTFGVNAITALRQSVINVISNMVKGFVDLLKGLASIVFNTLKGVATSAVNAVKDLPSKFIKIGKQIIQGLIDGIKSLNPIKIIGDIGSKMIDKVKGIFDINSPSRVFNTIGNQVMQGLTNGVNQLAEAPVRAIVGVSSKVVDSSKKLLSTAVASVTGIVKDVTTVATKSYSEFDKQIKTATDKSNKEILAIEKKAIQDVEKLRADNRNKEKKNYEKLSKDILKVREKAAKDIKKIETNLDKEIQKINEARLENERRIKTEINKTNEDYTKRAEDINKRLAESEKEVNKVYTDAYNSRYSALTGFAKVFDEFKQENEISGDQLVENLRGQVNALTSYTEEINLLSTRGLDAALFEEISQLGVNALPELRALNSLTDEELTEYSNLYATKAALARTQTEAELAGLRADTNQEIVLLREGALEELTLLEEEWIREIKLIRSTTEDELKDLREVGVNASQSLLQGITSQESALVARARQVAENVRKALEGDASVGVGVNLSSSSLRGTSLDLGNVISPTSSSGGVSTSSNSVSNASNNFQIQNVFNQAESTPYQSARETEKVIRALAVSY